MIQEPIREDLTYEIAHSTEDNLWSIPYLTGYLTQVSLEKLPEGMQPEARKVALRIPNKEVKSVFGSTVKTWFEEKLRHRTAPPYSQHGGTTTLADDIIITPFCMAGKRITEGDTDSTVVTVNAQACQNSSAAIS